jgi:hypothetical protein
MNMLDHASMVPPPAPQPAGLRRLRIAGAVLLLLSTLSVAFIHAIAVISIYAVAVVIVVMLAAIVVTTIYWVKRSRLEKSYWTGERTAAHIDSAAGRIRATAGKGRR